MYCFLDVYVGGQIRNELVLRTFQRHSEDDTDDVLFVVICECSVINKLENTL